MGLDMTAWGLFIAGLINQMGRVMIPAVKTTIMADPVRLGGFKEQVGSVAVGGVARVPRWQAARRGGDR